MRRVVPVLHGEKEGYAQSGVHASLRTLVYYGVYASPLLPWCTLPAYHRGIHHPPRYTPCIPPSSVYQLYCTEQRTMRGDGP